MPNHHRLEVPVATTAIGTMPTLHWIGKEKVTNHHLDIPYHTLDLQYNFGLNQDVGDLKDAKDLNSDNPYNATNQDSDNLIIHADNLLALKSLLPQYEGRVKCIYIDPPYNTGNEGWVYNDNVSSPRFKKWLGQVVGKEGEDLTRHDKWLCMMYPRLKLLHKLLAEDGAIFISIDDNEQASLKMMMDEIFGAGNYLTSFVWKKAAGSQNDAKYVAISHEYIVSYAKKKNELKLKNLPLPDETVKAYKYEDEYVETRGKFQLRNLNDFSIGDRPGLHYDITCPDGTILNGKEHRWRCDIFRFNKRMSENRIVFKKEKSKWQVQFKLYLNEEKEEIQYDEVGNIIRRGVTPNSLLDTTVFTSEGGKVLKEIFGEKTFDYPKPPVLVEIFLNISTDKDSIILDSFAGSGTTAHAVLNLNKQDGGNRKFILIEMEDYAETITAERVKRVINGYSSTEGTGGSFSFYTLGERVLDDEQNLNPNLALPKIHGYIWYSETHTAYTQQATAAGYLGKYNNAGIYFHYQPHQVTVLDDVYLMNVTELCEQYIMYADICLLPEILMHKHNIIFKKIPRDISKL